MNKIDWGKWTKNIELEVAGMPGTTKVSIPKSIVDKYNRGYDGIYEGEIKDRDDNIDFFRKALSKHLKVAGHLIGWNRKNSAQYPHIIIYED